MKYESAREIIIYPNVEAVVRDRLVDAYPFEGCGVLIGKSTLENRVEIVRAAGTRNAEKMRGRDRYAIEPLDLLAIERELSGNKDGLRVIGFFHSHPDAPAKPSTTDLEMAQSLFDAVGEFYVYAIASVRERIVTDVTYWQLATDTTSFVRMTEK